MRTYFKIEPKEYIIKFYTKWPISKKTRHQILSKCVMLKNVYDIVRY